jgi:acyl-coenzyme A thioesterase PaaI-like protein
LTRPESSANHSFRRRLDPADLSDNRDMPDIPSKADPPEDSRPNTHCFVCGPDNAFGLHLSFRIENDHCHTEFIPDERHQGYDGWLHGGILGAVLDDVMANWFYLRGIKAVTGRMEIRYRSPVPIGMRLEAESWLAERRGRMGKLNCKAVNDSGKVIAEGTGTYLLDEGSGNPAAKTQGGETREGKS